jgi:hypothetical protein
MSELHLGQRRAAMGLLGGLVLERGMRPKGTENAWRDVADSWAQAPHEPRLLARMPAEMRTRAHGFLEQATALNSRHLAALEALAASQMAAGAFEPALELMRRLSDAHAGDAARCADLAMAAGDIQLVKLADLEAAGRHYRQAMTLVPGHPLAAARLETVKEQLARRAAAAAAAQRAEEQALAGSVAAPPAPAASASSPSHVVAGQGPAGREGPPSAPPPAPGSVPPPPPSVRPRTGEHRAGPGRVPVAVPPVSPSAAASGAPPSGPHAAERVPPPPAPRAAGGPPGPAGGAAGAAGTATDERTGESLSIEVEVDDV